MENLRNGEYEFVFPTNESYAIRIEFRVDANRQISVNKPEFL